MALLPIVEVPDPRLRQISSPVEKVDEEVRALVADMFETMYEALRYNPVFSSLSNDPRFAAIEDRMRQAINRERQKAGLAPISREAWISDPKTLLTKN
jgi:uncharacterized protein YkwD